MRGRREGGGEAGDCVVTLQLSQLCTGLSSLPRQGGRERESIFNITLHIL